MKKREKALLTKPTFSPTVIPELCVTDYHQTCCPPQCVTPCALCVKVLQYIKVFYKKNPEKKLMKKETEKSEHQNSKSHAYKNCISHHSKSQTQSKSHFCNLACTYTQF